MSRSKEWQMQLHRETLEHMQINEDPDATLEDAMWRNRERCGKWGDDGCTKAGTEYCDWECPYR